MFLTLSCINLFSAEGKHSPSPSPLAAHVLYALCESAVTLACGSAGWKDTYSGRHQYHNQRCFRPYSQKTIYCSNKMTQLFLLDSFSLVSHSPQTEASFSSWHESYIRQVDSNPFLFGVWWCILPLLPPHLCDPSLVSVRTGMFPVLPCPIQNGTESHGLSPRSLWLCRQKLSVFISTLLQVTLPLQLGF